MSAHMPPVDRAALLSALRDVQDAMPNHPYWGRDDDGAVCWFGLKDNPRLAFTVRDDWPGAVADDREWRCDAVAAASHACMYWNRRAASLVKWSHVETGHDVACDAAAEWATLLDILDPMERESAERKV
jgi:hypothetical protein